MNTFTHAGTAHQWINDDSCYFVVACVLEGVEYQEGSKWHPDGPCSSCTCVNGEPLCTHTHCPSTDCLHPTKSAGTTVCTWALVKSTWVCDVSTLPFLLSSGSCCAVCESCTYNQRIYSNGKRFTTPERPCHICTCQVNISSFIGTQHTTANP